MIAANARRRHWTAAPPPLVVAWALFERSFDGRAFRPLPVVYATRAQARADRQPDEVVRRVAILCGRWRDASTVPRATCKTCKTAHARARAGQTLRRTRERAARR